MKQMEIVGLDLYNQTITGGGDVYERKRNRPPPRPVCADNL